MDTEESVDHLTETKPNKWIPRILSALLIIVLIGISVLTTYHVDKVIITPGTATSVESAIQIQGVKRFPPTGTIRFLTVLVSSKRPSLMEYLRARYFDDDAEIFTWKQVNGDLSSAKSDQLNATLMKESQGSATAVALTEIGCDVSQSGTGAIITQIGKKSPAEKAGLVPGDVITDINGNTVTLNSDVTGSLQEAQPGDEASVTYESSSDKKTKTKTIVLAKNPSDSSRPFLGVAVTTRNFEFNFPIDVSIDPGDVSGPSAGLAFTLSTIDQLTEGELTGGKDIAITGEISLDGSVSQVGGVKEKAVAARNAGANFMIVPKGEGKDVRKNAGPMKVYEVSSIDEALDVLKVNGGDPLPQMRSCPTT